MQRDVYKRPFCLCIMSNQQTKPTKIFIVAGEASGDIHASKLMRELKKTIPNCEFYGIGGACMEKEGLTSLVSQKEMSVVGFWEVAKRYRFLKSVLTRCSTTMVEKQCSVFIPVDYPGFNMRLAAHATKHEIPVEWYIAPQLWAWGKNRAKKLAKIVNHLLVVFPFEQDFFSQYGINTTLVGHPLLDDSVFASEFVPLSQRNNAIAFFPGSRVQEVQRHLPLFKEIAKELKRQDSTIELIIAKTPSLPSTLFEDAELQTLFSFSTSSRELLQTCKAGLVKTGTSTLEAALAGLPFAMMYKTSTVSFAISKHLVTLNYIALPNIIANKPIVREFIQSDVQPKGIAEELLKLYNNAEYASSMQQEFIAIKQSLGNSGASKRAAEHIVSMLNKQL